MTLTEAAEWTRKFCGKFNNDPLSLTRIEQAALVMAAHIIDDGPDSLADHKRRLSAKRSQVIRIIAEVFRIAGELEDAIADKDRKSIAKMPERLRQIVRWEKF